MEEEEPSLPEVTNYQEKNRCESEIVSVVSVGGAGACPGKRREEEAGGVGLAS